MSASSITVECRRCGHAFIVPRSLIVAGTWQRSCPVCYPTREPPSPVPLRHADVPHDAA